MEGALAPDALLDAKAMDSRIVQLFFFFSFLSVHSFFCVCCLFLNLLTGFLIQGSYSESSSYALYRPILSSLFSLLSSWSFFLPLFIFDRTILSLSLYSLISLFLYESGFLVHHTRFLMATSLSSLTTMSRTPIQVASRRGQQIPSQPWSGSN